MSNWVFVYNSYQDMWHAFKREEWVAYWNGKAETLIKARKLDTLTYMINHKLV
jgi:hypothetical protein